MNLNDFFTHSDAITLFLAALLLSLSVASWVVMVWKWRLLARASLDVRRAIAAFWQAPAFDEARQRVAQFDRDACVTPLLDATLLPLGGTLASAADRHQQLTRVLRDALQAVVRRLQWGQLLLATAGSTSPFIGLLGTVLGIFNALTGMADVMVSGGDPAEAVVARMDWAKFLPIYSQAGSRALLAEVAREVPESATAGAVGASGNTRLVEQLIAAPVQQRKKLVLEYLRDAVAEVTRIEASEIREETGFFDLGMDSLMAVELRRRLEQGVGKELPATLAMDHPRLTDVADYLLSDILNLSEKAGAKAVTEVKSLAAADEPIAIVSVACRFPGSPDPDAFWQVLSQGVDAISEIPEDRFDVDEFYDPDAMTPGKIYTRSGGYLDSVDTFDPEFFGISPREAVWIDPQQRLMLEIAWEGLERAGYAPAALRGSRTGVFIGVGANEYSHLLSGGSVENLEPHFITGNALNAIAGRVSFTLGLEGPAMAVDTACSSSLVAVHQAVQALHAGDCDMAP